MPRRRYDDCFTRSLPDNPDVIAADGMEVGILTTGDNGSMAQFALGARETGRAVRHKTVEELWYVLEGRCALWRNDVNGGAPMEVGPGDSFRIPVGTSFQIRVDGAGPLKAVAVTMPPWPGEDEVEVVEGYWSATVGG